MSKDPLMTTAVSSGGGEGICILGVAHLPSLGSILTGVGLDHMLADLATPAFTRLDELDDKVRHLLDWRVQEDARPWNNTLDPFMRNLCYLWRKFRYTDDSHDKLYFAAWEERGVTSLSWSRGGTYEPGVFATPGGRDCGRAIAQLEKLIPYLGRSCCRSSIHPDALPHLQASDAGCVIGKLTSSSADQPYIVYLLFGETDFMPLFLLPIDSDFTLAYPSPEREVRDDSAASTSLSHVGISASQVVETLVSLFPNKPDNPPSESRLPERNAAMSELSHPPPSPPLKDYRLATFTDLQKCETLSAAFVDRDGRLAALHDLSPFSRLSTEADAASNFPTPPATPSPPSLSNSTVTGLDKPLLLVSSEKLGFGHQGVVHRAYCADSPFPLVVKYSCEPEWERHDTFERLCDEIAFYQAHGAGLAAEGIAPRFVGGWTTEGESSPRMCGTRTAVLVLEEWGEAMKESEDQTFEDLDKDGRKVSPELLA
ncbi:hypothetical protein RTBOTA2_006689 [Rhodotorula toruloides]|nr:hypothetical protein RTBOTA2_006689 [Rhodotorula toruloides]